MTSWIARILDVTVTVNLVIMKGVSEMAHSFLVTYARIVIMEQQVTADSEDAALQKALDMEREGTMPSIYPKGMELPSHVTSIEDYDVIWSAEEIDKIEEGE